MVASIGVVPVQAIATAVGGTSALNWAHLANAFGDRIQPIPEVAGISRDVHALGADMRTPVEMVVSLEGNSLAAEQAARMDQGLPALDAAGQKSFVASVRLSQATVRASLLTSGVQIPHEYHIVFNGFDVVASRATLSRVLSLPGVARLDPVQSASPSLDNSVPFLLGGRSYGDLGADGTGTRIAIIDTGIDYTHADFGGSGNPADYAAIDPTVITPGTFPTAKIIGGTDLVGVASNAAAALGILVVASAGNSGDLPFFAGSPAVATNAISVAAGNDPGIKLQLMAVAGSTGVDGDKESLEGALTVPLATAGAQTGPAVQLGAVGTSAARACNALPAGSLTGKIPLIERGICTFATKILNAQDAGAIAVVVYNQFAGADAIVMGGSPAGITIPGVMIGNLDGIAVSGAIGPSTTFTLDPANQLPIPNRLQGFTSRGPRFRDAVRKLDVPGPRANTYSSLCGSGDDGFDLSGTSMASPHVAGAAALLRQLHPRWSVTEIKALLMNPAADPERAGTVYPVALEGAGRVRVDVAAQTWSVVVPGSASFGVRESDRTGVQTVHRSEEH